MSKHAVEVTSGTWDEVVLASEGPVFVDFWAAWCAPCRAVAPAVESVAGSLTGRATVAKLDIDGSPEVAERYGVSSIPTFIVFVGGREVARARGARPAAALRELLEPHLQPEVATTRSEV